MPAGGDRWSDLVSEMYCVVHEQAHLFEVTSQVVDVSSDGDRVTHGPWEAVECQSVLLPWHRAGWLDLLADVDPPHGGSEAVWRERARRDGAYLVLAASDAYDEWVERCRG